MVVNVIYLSLNLFDELVLVKKDFVIFLDSYNKMTEVISSARLVNQYIQAYMIRMRKIRMMIGFKI